MTRESVMKRRTFLSAAAASLLMPRSANAQQVIKLRDLYNNDLSFSEICLQSADQTVVVGGFMAPPLKAESSFFVLTKMPMSVCPFCDSEADWPGDIVSVYTENIVEVVPFNRPINVTGTLKLGTYRDEELGFVSLLRLTGARFSMA